MAQGYADYEAEIYRLIGEFVVSFQWMEHLFRQIGWRILDPEQQEWPPRALRAETNHDLINKVEELYLRLMGELEFEGRDELIAEFSAIAKECHELRKRRNVLLHSAYIELKGGGEVQEIMRTGMKLSVDPETEEAVFDSENLTPDGMNGLMRSLARTAFRLGQQHLQIIHLVPFDHLRRKH